jgi:hypothetical protein
MSFIVRKDGSAIVSSNGASIIKTNIPLFDNGFGELVPGQYVPPADTSMPTNWIAFALVLNENGSFAATNIPPGFFFNWPAMAEAHGKWSLNSSKSMVSKSEYQSLSFSFRRPRSGEFETPISWLAIKPRLPKQPVVPLFLTEHSTICLAIDENLSPTNREPQATNPGPTNQHLQPTPR